MRTSPRHEAKTLGQANIDIPNKATDFSILGVYWADINGVSVHLFLKNFIRVLPEFQVLYFVD